LTDTNKSIPLKNESLFWTLSKSLSFLIVITAISLKVYNSEIELKMDVPTFLSILLALFSVGLSAIFYFKATDTSNKFYDNSYKYTKDVAQLLVKIESGFGERLKKLDEGYLSMKEEIQKIPAYGVKVGDDLKVEIEKTKKELASEKQELEKIKSDRDLIIKSMIEKSKLLQSEKDEILSQLTEKESEVSETQQQVMKLNKRLFAERMSRKELNVKQSETLDRVESFSRDVLEHNISGHGLVHQPFREFREEFKTFCYGFPDEYLKDMASLGYLTNDHDLTKKGALFLRSLVNENL
jgi:hypothetical protein